VTAPVRGVKAYERSEVDPTSGMVREEAIATDKMWSGLVRTAAGSVSGWHHHGDHETSIYVVSGIMRIEWGPGGREVVDLESDDFCFIPPGTIHRESNMGEAENRLVVVRSGIGPPTTNVDGPEKEG
jgi:uncharacterized RmlC-like cupin family protein